MSEPGPSPETCPECGSEAVVPIAYGLPGPELTRDALAGKVVLGGCFVRGGAPERACRDCGNEW